MLKRRSSTNNLQLLSCTRTRILFKIGPNPTYFLSHFRFYVVIELPIMGNNLVDLFPPQIGKEPDQSGLEVPFQDEYWPPSMDSSVSAPNQRSPLQLLSDLIVVCAALGCIVVVAYYLREHDERCAGCPHCFPYSWSQPVTATEETKDSTDSTQHHLLTLKRPGIDVDCLERDTDSGSQTPQTEAHTKRVKKMIPIRQRQDPPFDSETKDLFGTSPSPRHFLLDQSGLGNVGLSSPTSIAGNKGYGSLEGPDGDF